MSMKSTHELREMLCKQLDDFTQQAKARKKDELSPDGVDLVYKMTDSIKNLHKIEMYDSGGGYSNAGMWEAEMRGEYGHSHANRGQHYVRGHYSNDGGYSNYSNAGYSHEGGYANAGGYSNEGGYSQDGYSNAGYSNNAGRSVMDSLQKAMKEAQSEHERDKLRRCMEMLK